jgi:hypothetical protein
MPSRLDISDSHIIRFCAATVTSGFEKHFLYGAHTKRLLDKASLDKTSPEQNVSVTKSLLATKRFLTKRLLTKRLLDKMSQ